MRHIGTIPMSFLSIQIPHQKIIQWLSGFKFWEKIFLDLVTPVDNLSFNISNMTSGFKHNRNLLFNKSVFN